MINHTNFDIEQRYNFLCNILKTDTETDNQNFFIYQHIENANSLLDTDLPNIPNLLNPSFHKELKNILNRLKNKCLFPQLASKTTVGIGGAFSAGKSSLINNLLGKKTLIVEVDPSTAIPTYISYDSEEKIIAVNKLYQPIKLREEEFLTLTHDEKENYGSNISSFISAISISDPSFSWNNLVLIDTPGYSKPNNSHINDRTDESISRLQLNQSDYIIWVVSATQGTITDNDLIFLKTLNPDIPKLIVISRADSKTEKEIEDITKLIKSTLFDKKIDCIEVIPISSRRKELFPLQPLINYLNQWQENTKDKKIKQHGFFSKLLKDEYKNINNFKYREEVIKKFSKLKKNIKTQINISKNKLLKLKKISYLSTDSMIIRMTSDIILHEESLINYLINSYENLCIFEKKFIKEINKVYKALNFEIKYYDIENSINNLSCSSTELELYESITDDDRLLEKIYLHENCPHYLIENYFSKSYLSYEPKQIESILRNCKLPNNSSSVKEFIDEIGIENLDILTLQNLSNWPHLPVELQLHLNFNLHELLDQYLKEYPASTEEDIKDWLRTNIYVQIVKNLAENSSLCDQLKNQFIHGFASIRKSLAKNLTLSEKIQTILANDEKDFVRLMLAANPTITSNVQNILASDTEEVVRFALAKNIALTLEVQKKLLNDENIHIRVNLIKNPELNEMLLYQVIQNFFMGGLINTIKPELQEIWSKDQNTQVRRNLAGAQNLIYPVQNILANDKSYQVRAKLASNQNLAPTIYNLLAHDRDGLVLEYLAENPYIDLQVQNILCQELIRRENSLVDDPTFRETQALMSNTENIRINLTNNPSLSPDILIKLKTY